MDINKQIADYQSKINTLKKSILIQTIEYMNGKKFTITNLEPRLKKSPEKKDLLVHIYYNNEHEMARLFVKKYKDDKAERVSRLLKEMEDNNYQTN